MKKRTQKLIFLFSSETVSKEESLLKALSSQSHTRKLSSSPWYSSAVVASAPGVLLVLGLNFDEIFVFGYFKSQISK